ncbi:MAG: hypothetical protein ACN2B6_05600 [Rickettsiales bacterium]
MADEKPVRGDAGVAGDGIIMPNDPKPVPTSDKPVLGKHTERVAASEEAAKPWIGGGPTGFGGC